MVEQKVVKARFHHRGAQTAEITTLFPANMAEAQIKGTMLKVYAYSLIAERQQAARRVTKFNGEPPSPAKVTKVYELLGLHEPDLVIDLVWPPKQVRGGRR
jgi:hypothetical protein